MGLRTSFVGAREALRDARVNAPTRNDKTKYDLLLEKTGRCFVSSSRIAKFPVVDLDT